jgi:hypothetical protein
MKAEFDAIFKFQINQPVRHKGDTKNDYSADMGLLVLERHLIESEDADNNRTYEKAYVCRMIRFSGSGDLARFQERELMSIADHTKEQLDRQQESNEMRNDCKMVEKEIMQIFDVTKEDYLYEIVNGTPDTSKKFRWSGFKIDDTGATLLVTESLFTASTRNPSGNELKVKRESREWTAKNQFQKVTQ